jgi:hypothetical protein
MPQFAESARRNLQERGVALPRNQIRARLDAADMHDMARTPGDLRLTVANTIPSDIQNADAQRIFRENAELSRAMGERRAMVHAMQRHANVGTPMGGDVYAAMPRFYDPVEYWDLSGLPWNVADEGHRRKLHKWLRLYYATHYLVPILVDIFTRFPLVGMEVETKDKQLTAFYEDLFLDTLDYESFLVSLGREYWCVGEAFPLGSFDEDLGIWEREELINPDQVTVNNIPFLDSRQFKIVPPDYLKRLVRTQSPAKEYQQMLIGYPELVPYLSQGKNIPVSNVLMKHVGNFLNDWDDHGTPILLRGLRTLLHEEKLLASQDAIAERLYSPLLLAKLGIQDLGDGQGPWIPGPEHIAQVRDDLDIALSSDFRLMVHHFGLEITNVFGREQMPRLGDDFDRIERRLMQTFGVNPSLLSAGASTQPYASSALQAEFLNQILATYQKMLVTFFKSRAAVVAEAQGHYDYEKKGQTRIKIMERVVEYDEEGNKNIVEKPKLLIPDLKFSTLDLRDEATERQFLQTLRSMGVPIPDKKLMVGIPYDVKELSEEYDDELVWKTVNQQASKVKAFIALKNQNLPIPPQLYAEVAQVLGPDGGVGGGSMPPGPPGAPGGPTGPAANGPGGPIVMPGPPPGLTPGGLGPGGAGGAVPGGGPPPRAPTPGGPPGSVPPVSNERRPGLDYNATASVHDDQVSQLREDESEERIVHSDDSRVSSGSVEEGLPNLRFNQVIEERDGEKVITEKKPSRKEFRASVEPEKRFSIINEDAPNDEEEELESEPESPRPTEGEGSDLSGVERRDEESDESSPDRSDSDKLT